MPDHTVTRHWGQPRETTIEGADLEFDQGDLVFSRAGLPIRRIRKGHWKKVEVNGVTVVAMTKRHLARRRRTG